MHYSVSLTVEVEGDITPEEALEASRLYLSGYGRLPNQTVSVYRSGGNVEVTCNPTRIHVAGGDTAF